MQQERQCQRRLGAEQDIGAADLERARVAVQAYDLFDDFGDACRAPALLQQDVVRLAQGDDALLQRLDGLTIGHAAQRLADDRLHHGERVLQPVAEFVVEDALAVLGFDPGDSGVGSVCDGHREVRFGRPSTSEATRCARRGCLRAVRDGAGERK